MSCRGAAGVGHIDVRVGAVGNQRVRMLHHFRRHVGVQIEADDEGQILADHLAHACQNFAFAVIVMFRHHRAVQVEIDRIERAGACDAVDHLRDDAFERVFGHVGRGAGAAGNRRYHLPAVRGGLLGEACKPDIDLFHDLEHIRPVRHRRPAAAMHEIGIGRLGRRESVGLVQEAADGDAGHLFSLGQCFRWGTLSGSLWQAQAVKQFRFACRVIRNSYGKQADEF